VCSLDLTVRTGDEGKDLIQEILLRDIVDQDLLFLREQGILTDTTSDHLQRQQEGARIFIHQRIQLFIGNHRTKTVLKKILTKTLFKSTQSLKNSTMSILPTLSVLSATLKKGLCVWHVHTQFARK